MNELERSMIHLWPFKENKKENRKIERSETIFTQKISDSVKVQEIRKLGEELLEKGYRLGCQTFVTNRDISIYWDEEVTEQVKRRKPDKIKKEVTSS